MATANVDWGTLAVPGALLLATVAGAFGASKLSSRVNRLEQDVKEIKADIKRIYELLYRQMGPDRAENLSRATDG